jgi:hypothetical protein
MGFATEMSGGWAASGSQIPLDDSELLISALDYKPMDRILTDDPANLALEFLQTRHALSVEQWLGKSKYSGSLSEGEGRRPGLRIP